MKKVKGNEIILRKDCAIIKIRFKWHTFNSLIDLEDVELIKKYTWQLSSKRYAFTNLKGKTILMHRIIMNPDNLEGLQIDHKNRIKLDSRRKNLGFVTNKANSENKLSKGFSWHKRASKWEARIMHNGRNIHLGYFCSELDAATAYINAKVELHKNTSQQLIDEYKAKYIFPHVNRK